MKGAGIGLPVIAMSADSSGQSPGDGTGPRFDGHIDKPLCVETLARVLLPLAPLRHRQGISSKAGDPSGQT
jgi:hypothetical protein